MTKLETCILQIKAKYFNLIKNELTRNLERYDEPFISRIINIEELYRRCEVEISNAKLKFSKKQNTLIIRKSKL